MTATLTLTAWHLLSFFVAGSIASLMGVFIGGYLVYKTKKESHEFFFEGKVPADDGMTATNIDELDEEDLFAQVERQEYQTPPPFRNFEERNAEFLKTMYNEDGSRSENHPEYHAPTGFASSEPETEPTPDHPVNIDEGDEHGDK